MLVMLEDLYFLTIYFFANRLLFVHISNLIYIRPVERDEVFPGPTTFGAPHCRSRNIFAVLCSTANLIVWIWHTSVVTRQVSVSLPCMMQPLVSGGFLPPLQAGSCPQLWYDTSSFLS